jgi:hypothetical protein
MTEVMMSKVPSEILDLVRFLAETWVEIDNFVIENCPPESFGKYPMVQGTRNKINIMKIGQQGYDRDKLYAALEWMISNGGG